MKFYFGDKVKVIGGFYKDTIGIVLDYNKALDPTLQDMYFVDGWKSGCGFVKSSIIENDLEKLEE